MRRTARSAVAIPLTAAVIAVLGGCDMGRQETTAPQRRAAAPTPQVDESAYSVDTGTGGRSAQERGTGDALRYAFYGLPRTAPLAPQLLVLWNDGYVLGYDVNGKTPVWACYRLFDTENVRPEKTNRERVGGMVDSRLPAASDPAAAMGKDKKAEGSVEHVLVPAAPLAACYGEAAGDQAYLSSAALVRPGRNAASVGPGWSQLADLEPAYAKAYGEVWVMCGPLGSGDKAEGLWKIQVTVQDGRPRTQAFIIPANADPKQRENADLASHLVPVHEIEQRTGLTFFTDYHDVNDDDNRQLLETQVPEGLWPTTAPAVAPLPSIKTASRQGMSASSR